MYKLKWTGRAMALGLATTLMLAGCSSGSSAATSTAGDNQTTAAAGEASTIDGSTATDTQKYDDVKLKMLICWNGGFKTASDQYNNEVAQAIRDKIGVTVEYEGIMMSETEKLNLVFASGDMPDMINAPYWGGDGGETAVIKKAAREGQLLDIKDELPKYANLSDAYDVGIVSQAFLENDLDDPTFGGARYILPQETPGDVADITNWAYGVFVRGDVADTLGIDPTTIKTTDQLLDFMTKARDYGFKDVNGNDIITATTFHEGWDYGQYAMNFNSKQATSFVKQDDGTYTYNTLTDNWIDSNLFIWKLVNEGILDKECFKQSDDLANQKVGNGTALFAAAQYSTVINATKLTGLYDSNPEMRYVPVGPLNYADGEASVQVELKGRNGSPAIIFPTSNQNLEASLAYLDYVNSEEGARLCQYGIEGDTYEMNSEGQPRLLQSILERKQNGDTTVDDELREKGIGYILGRTLQADKRMTWWGERGAGDADVAITELVAYQEARPVEQLAGYPIDKLAQSFEDYDTLKTYAFDDTTKNDYTQRAFFADTEDEARSILEDYQDYLTSQEGGLFQKYLDYANEVAKTRDDVIN
ncbi:hypothetical protein HCH52_05415 [Oscillospiraceae bacterium HV4-5-C5C]|nr:hypothetical protein [Oscillospiraceae bacterium HV4-5-C5C]